MSQLKLSEVDFQDRNSLVLVRELDTVPVTFCASYWFINNITGMSQHRNTKFRLNGQKLITNEELLYPLRCVLPDSVVRQGRFL